MINQDEARKKRTRKQLSSIAKITHPYVTGILPRTRLYNILDSSRNSPVTFIISPPGSGKTALISSYLSNRKIPYLWYSIDRGDEDVATFFHYMELASQKAFPENGPRLGGGWGGWGGGGGGCGGGAGPGGRPF